MQKFIKRDGGCITPFVRKFLSIKGHLGGFFRVKDNLQVATPFFVPNGSNI